MKVSRAIILGESHLRVQLCKLLIDVGLRLGFTNFGQGFETLRWSDNKTVSHVCFFFVKLCDDEICELNSIL